ncbi:MAG: Fic family protein [Patescibacteria group bacterium]
MTPQPQTNPPGSGTYHQHTGKPQQYEWFLPAEINQPYQWRDPELPRLLEEGTHLLGQLSAAVEHQPARDGVIRMTMAAEAVDSSRIEDILCTIEEAILPEEEIAQKRRLDWHEVQYCIAAQEDTLDSLNKAPLTMKLLHRAHEILLQGPRGEGKQPGMVRTRQNWIGGKHIDKALYVPPHPDALPPLLTDLERFLHNDTLGLPRLITAGMAHYQFEVIHPYLDGNGRIGRLLIALYLSVKQLLSAPVLPLSSYFREQRPAYYDALSIARVTHNLDAWLRFFLEGIVTTAEQQLQRFDQIQKLQEQYAGKTVALGSRADTAADLLAYLYGQPIVSVPEVAELLNVSFPTANDLVGDLAELGMLKETTGMERGRLFGLWEYVQVW